MWCPSVRKPAAICGPGAGGWDTSQPAPRRCAAGDGRRRGDQTIDLNVRPHVRSDGQGGAPGRRRHGRDPSGLNSLRSTGGHRHESSRAAPIWRTARTSRVRPCSAPSWKEVTDKRRPGNRLLVRRSRAGVSGVVPPAPVSTTRSWIRRPNDTAVPENAWLRDATRRIGCQQVRLPIPEATRRDPGRLTIRPPPL